MNEILLQFFSCIQTFLLYFLFAKYMSLTCQSIKWNENWYKYSQRQLVIIEFWVISCNYMCMTRTLLQNAFRRRNTSTHLCKVEVIYLSDAEIIMDYCERIKSCNVNFDFIIRILPSISFLCITIAPTNSIKIWIHIIVCAIAL